MEKEAHASLEETTAMCNCKVVRHWLKLYWLSRRLNYQILIVQTRWWLLVYAEKYLKSRLAVQKQISRWLLSVFKVAVAIGFIVYETKSYTWNGRWI